MGVFLQIVADILSFILSVLFAPVGALFALIPNASDIIDTFFEAIGDYVGSFLTWLVYVLGISQTTWHVFWFASVVAILFSLSIFPVKLVMSWIRGH